MSHRKDMAALVAEAKRQGWKTHRTRNGHWALYPPSGKGMVNAAGTPGSASSIIKTVARMRRLGFTWKGR